jgi:hypothetical protein
MNTIGSDVRHAFSRPGEAGSQACKSGCSPFERGDVRPLGRVVVSRERILAAWALVLKEHAPEIGVDDR